MTSCCRISVAANEHKLLQLAESSLAENNLRQAIAACRELNTMYPDNFAGWRVAGEIHTRMGKPDAVLFSTSKAEALCAGDPVIALQRIEAHIGLDDIETARKLLLAFDDTTVDSAGIHDRIGRHLASLDLHEDALRHYRKALDLDPENPGLLYNLATAQRFLGDTKAAIETLDRMLAIDGRDFEAQAMRSSLQKQTAESNHIAELEDLLANGKLSDGGITSICYALAKEYDDLDRFDESFRSLKQGADLRRSRMDYRAANDLAIVSRLIEVCSSEFFAACEPGDPSNEPIFIVGMPRTGTTLVERILGSHSSVYAAGELDNYGREMMRQFEAMGIASGSDKSELIAACVNLDFAKLGRAYVESTRPMTAGSPRFIDKLPFNYLYVGLIHQALPNARIINLMRHPMATCYSVYKQLFRDPYPFSYDLPELAHYLVAYRQLMDHWQQVLPGVVCTVNYEDLVNDTEYETRRMLEYCGLDWEDQCLRFYENRQPSTTASAAQVRQPVYRSSLDRWTKYRDYLQPAERILREAGMDTREMRA